MLAGISGGRGDGTMWPPQGGTLEVDADEGASLCRAHLAVPVAEPEPEPEKAVPPRDDVEERTAPKTARSRAAKQD